MDTTQLAYPKSCQECEKDNCFIKQYCDEEWLSLLEMHKSVIDFPKGSRIFSEGQNVQGIYIIYSGKVKVLTASDHKTERIIRLASDGDLLGHRGFGGNDTYPISAETLTPTKIAFIPTHIFMNIVKANHKLTYHMMLFFAEELRTSEENMRNLSLLSVKQRVSCALMLNAQVFGMNEEGILSFTLSRKDIANLAATTYETVIRSLKELANENIIQLNGKNIQILQQEKLKAYYQ